MFTVNDDLSIYATRGDIVFFSVSAEDDGKPYKFQAGDVVRVKVYGKKDAENVVLQKDFPVTDITENVTIFLTEEDTKIGDVISKHKDYWYEVELNPHNNPQTIIGYDEDGAKVFRLFPEGDDIPEWTPAPEDIPVVLAIVEAETVPSGMFATVARIEELVGVASKVAKTFYFILNCMTLYEVHDYGNTVLMCFINELLEFFRRTETTAGSEE